MNKATVQGAQCQEQSVLLGVLETMIGTLSTACGLGYRNTRGRVVVTRTDHDLRRVPWQGSTTVHTIMQVLIQSTRAENDLPVP